MKSHKADAATKVEDFVALKISSKSFEHDAKIPVKHTCDGIDINPAIHIDNIPQEAKSLAVIVDDPDAPRGTFSHWVLFNVPVTHVIIENERRGMQGVNDFGKHEYGGPCPPSGTHRYHFKVYALDEILNITPNSNKAALEQAMAGHILGFGLLIGRYSRHKEKT